MREREQLFFSAGTPGDGDDLRPNSEIVPPPGAAWGRREGFLVCGLGRRSHRHRLRFSERISRSGKDLPKKNCVKEKNDGTAIYRKDFVTPYR